MTNCRAFPGTRVASPGNRVGASIVALALVACGGRSDLESLDLSGEARCGAGAVSVETGGRRARTLTDLVVDGEGDLVAFSDLVDFTSLGYSNLVGQVLERF